MKPPILNLADVKLVPLKERMPTQPPGGFGRKFDGRMGEIGGPLGSQKLGYNITAVPPGMRAFPFHNHRVNEEMFFILEGSGQLRVGPDTYPVKQGDFIASLPGGPELAHQLVNTGDGELRYLAVSTRLTPEIVDYPDSGKFGVSMMGADGKPQFRQLGRREQALDYWDGE
ncbi:MAG TPA: cupin domain-containing protein [Nevskiaceae bacterium]|nr:cupin domain-containing protein [Nevskiaceae bacterium]